MFAVVPNRKSGVVARAPPGGAPVTRRECQVARRSVVFWLSLPQMGSECRAMSGPRNGGNP